MSLNCVQIRELAVDRNGVMDRWVGRTALVTGASAGFGAAICKRLVELGMTVVGCARNADRIKVFPLFTFHLSFQQQTLNNPVTICF